MQRSSDPIVIDWDFSSNKHWIAFLNKSDAEKYFRADDLIDVKNVNIRPEPLQPICNGLI